MKALEIKERGAVELYGRIARNHRLDVHAGSIDKLIASLVGKLKDVPEVHREITGPPSLFARTNTRAEPRSE